VSGGSDRVILTILERRGFGWGKVLSKPPPRIIKQHKLNMEDDDLNLHSISSSFRPKNHKKHICLLKTSSPIILMK
jgi:hypothetical protein